jgi:hypothetical protein
MVPKESQFDLTYSYWIFAWFLLFYFGYTTYNPNIWLIIASIENLSALLIGIYNNQPLLRTVMFIVINFFIKVVPIYLLWNTPYRLEDFIAGIHLLLIYLLWCLIRLGSINNMIQYAKNIYNANLHNKPSTPLITFLAKWYNL